MPTHSKAFNDRMMPGVGLPVHPPIPLQLGRRYNPSKGGIARCRSVEAFGLFRNVHAYRRLNRRRRLAFPGLTRSNPSENWQKPDC